MTTDTLTLADFLLARIEEDEALAWAAAESFIADGQRSWGNRQWDRLRQPVRDHVVRHDPARVLAECKAKRVALDWYENDDAVVMLPTIVALAVVYADHPDYRAEWAL